MDTPNTNTSEYVKLSVDLVSAYVMNNTVSTTDLPGLITQVHSTLKNLGENTTGAVKEDLKPAVPVKKSVSNDFIICLEDGKKFKSLKRHLRTHYNLSPDEYRAKWNLPADYPMVAPSYSETRSSLAKQNGLGRKAA